MNAKPSDFSASPPLNDPHRALRIGGLIFAMLFPTVITWGYFVLAGRYSTGTQQTVYLTVKIIQIRVPGRVDAAGAPRAVANQPTNRQRLIARRGV